MVRRVAVMACVVLLPLSATACGPQEGQACSTPHQVHAQGGVTLHCEKNRKTGQYEWRR